MDRVELKMFLDGEQAAALNWYESTERAVAESEKVCEGYEKHIRSVGMDKLTDKERAQYEEAKETLEAARKQLIFFDGVKKGVDLVAHQIRERMAREELANAGKWIPKPIKPKWR